MFDSVSLSTTTSLSQQTDESQSYSTADQSSGDQAGNRLSIGAAQGAEFNISSDPLSIDLAKQIAGDAFAYSAQLGGTALASARKASDQAFDLAGKATETDTQKVFSGFKMLLWPVVILAAVIYAIWKWGGK